MAVSTVVTKIDDQGPWAWIGALVLSFILFWPAGLALLAFLMWSGRMGCRTDRWGGRGITRLHDAWQEQKRRWREGDETTTSTSGNRAFDEYRVETLRRLEEEEREFHDFLARLRQAKDRQEFDDFMTDRRRNSETGNRDAGSRGAGNAGPEPAGA